MKKSRLLIAAFLAIFLDSSVFASEQDHVQTPYPRDGEFWRFKASQTNWFGSQSTTDLGGVYEISYKNNHLRVSELSGDEKKEIRHAGLFELRRMLGFGQDSRQYLQFPLFVGKSWSTRYSYRVPEKAYPLWRSAHYEVIGIEEVTTPAGAFQTFKIKGEFLRQPKALNEIRGSLIYYYSPQVRSIVKFITESSIGASPGSGPKIEIELVKFGTVEQGK